jgi:multidrug efflux pump subunit AcrA (membrane-fusion protein)
MRWCESISRHWEVWRSAWEDQRHQRRAVGLMGREAEFLPAVLEIQEAPPSPVGRAVGGTVMAVFAVGLLWASIGHIDVVAVAPGKIIPSGYSKVVQPLDSGVIRAIHVQNGQAVQQGDLLIELDTTVTDAELKRLLNELRLQEERVRVYKQLLDKNFISRMEYLAAETNAVSLAQEVVKAKQRHALQRLTAPIDGEVQQLAVHTVGGVVTPGQQLLVVVPYEHHLEVEAMVENKDIGFVKKDQPVEVKVETFPFTRYGLIDGQIVSVSTDAVQLDQGGLVYSARVSLARSVIQVDGKPVRLAPGMAVSAEIKTGQRRVIEFFLSPLLKSGQESLRER